jgi:TonB family protein
MVAGPSRRSLVASVLLHLGVGLVAILTTRSLPRSPPAAARSSDRTVEIDFAPPPPSPVAPAPAAVPTAPSALAASASRPSAPRSAPSSAERTAPAPTVVPPAVAPTEVAPPVLTAPPAMRAADLMRVRPSEAFAVWGTAPSIAQAQAERARARSLVDLPEGTPESRAIAASQGYVDQRLAVTHQHEAPGVRGYYWSLRRRMLESWRPGISRMPSLGETLLATLAMPAAGLAEAARSANGAAVQPGRQGSAIDSLESRNTARSNNPAELTQAPFQGIVDQSHGNTRTTRAEVEVVQGEDGRVIEVRVLRSSHVASFDRAAEAAVRDALPLQSPVAMPGGRRSRWSFEVVASRDPFVPGVGFAFDESTGWFELHWPGRAHVRSRVWLEDASPVSRVARSPRG